MYATALNEITAGNGLVFTVRNKPETHNICVRVNGWPVWVKELINPAYKGEEI
jgi:hypothetical protein